jgi:transketolase
MNTITKADKIRKEILRVAVKNKQGHIAPSLSCVDILVILYYVIADKNDTIILSKGHGCYGLYAIWADLGLLDKDKWENFKLDGCVDGYGSLGHGLPIGVGVAFANKIMNKPNHTWVIVGEGEMQEGSNWEALSFMYHHDLTNITVIIDDNRLQAMDKTDNVIYAILEDRFEGWGFMPFRCNGHSHKELEAELGTKPQILIADTIKGKGVSFMENVACWHYRVPTQEELNGK